MINVSMCWVVMVVTLGTRAVTSRRSIYPSLRRTDGYPARPGGPDDPRSGSRADPQMQTWTGGRRWLAGPEVEGFDLPDSAAPRTSPVSGVVVGCRWCVR